MAGDRLPSWYRAVAKACLLEMAQMFRRADVPSWDRRGSEPRNEASGVVLNNASVASLL